LSGTGVAYYGANEMNASLDGKPDYARYENGAGWFRFGAGTSIAGMGIVASPLMLPAAAGTSQMSLGAGMAIAGADGAIAGAAYGALDSYTFRESRDIWSSMAYNGAMSGGVSALTAGAGHFIMPVAARAVMSSYRAAAPALQNAIYSSILVGASYGDDLARMGTAVRAGVRSLPFIRVDRSILNSTASAFGVGAFRALSVVRKSGLQNAQRGLLTRTEAHHPFFRMFLRSMKDAGIPGAKGLSGKFVRQQLAYLDDADHILLHGNWNEYVDGLGMPYLKTIQGNGDALTEELFNRNISPTKIFDMLDEFYLRTCLQIA
jgi:hypothetical protein